MENIDTNYKRLWRKEDESIPQFIPIHPKPLERESGRNGGRAPQTLTDSVPKPLAIRELVPLLALPAPRVDPQLEDLKSRLEDSYESKMVAHNCSMLRIYLELQLSSLLKLLKVLKIVRLGVELCFRP